MQSLNVEGVGPAPKPFHRPNSFQDCAGTLVQFTFQIKDFAKHIAYRR